MVSLLFDAVFSVSSYTDGWCTCRHFFKESANRNQSYIKAAEKLKIHITEAIYKVEKQRIERVSFHTGDSRKVGSIRAENYSRLQR